MIFGPLFMNLAAMSQSSSLSPFYMACKQLSTWADISLLMDSSARTSFCAIPMKEVRGAATLLAQWCTGT